VQLLGTKDVDILERMDTKGVIEWCYRSLLLISQGRAADILAAEVAKPQFVLLAQSFFYGGPKATERVSLSFCLSGLRSHDEIACHKQRLLKTQKQKTNKDAR